MKIYFIEKSIPFDSLDIDKPFISGSEKTLINISNELGNYKNLIVKVFNLTKNKKIIGKIEWNNIKNINPVDKPDILIGMSDANLLSLFKCNRNFLWSHSIQSIEKFLRKKQLFAFFKNKPIMILEGDYHFKNRSFFTSMFGKKKLPIAVDNDFINFKIDRHYVPNRKAIFTTRSDRNLDFLIKCWTSIIIESDNSCLYINPPFNLTDKHTKLGIRLRKKGNKFDLINELATSRVMLNPGHKGEVFCLAAEEARELCVPIVTLGIGSLSERVEHGITGFVAKNAKEFIDYTIKILNDDELYLRLKNNLMKKRNIRSYKNVAEDLLDIINEN